MIPITFSPIYFERVWGGRKLEEVYARILPSDQPYGESWELSDRLNEQSIVNDGFYEKKSLNQLWTEHKSEIFGEGLPESEHFPLLIKILDANSNLSIQVHPPEHLIQSLGGEAKTEMWYIAAAAPGAKLYVGLKNGVTKDAFEAAIRNGTVDQLIHTIEPKAGEFIFIESGRLHSIGAGLLIYEIQQNSDTTYRVFDWNRLGLDGKPRQLHVEESLACIDFNDFEPSMDAAKGTTISSCEHFKVDERNFSDGQSVVILNPAQFAVVIVVKGALIDNSGRVHEAGSFMLVPAKAAAIKAKGDTKILETVIPV
jgi:mannose-6-phosphate isomerase